MSCISRSNGLKLTSEAREQRVPAQSDDGFRCVLSSRAAAPARLGDAPADKSSDADATGRTAPMLGTFYRAPKPGEPPFVEVGSRVEPDTIIGIIEVMKLMNTVRSAGSRHGG